MHKQIAVIPMDNRAYSTSDPVFIGRMSGWTVINPPPEITGNDLSSDAQSDGLSKWLETVAAASDCIIMPLDPLLSGGCVKTMYSAPTPERLEQVMAVIAEIKKRNPCCCIYTFKIIHGMSAGDFINAGATEKNAEDLYEYFQLSGPTNQGAECEARKKQLENRIPEKLPEKHLNIRKQQLELNKLLAAKAKENCFDYLLFTQADVPETGIHLQEQKELLDSFAGAYDRISLMTGLDEAILLLMARYINHKQGIFPKFFIRYSSAAGPQLKCLFEDRALDDNIRNHITIAGGICTDTPESADHILLVHTPEKRQIDQWLNPQEEIPNRNLWSFAAAVRFYLDQAKQVAIIDAAFANGGDDFLISFLKSVMDLRDLAAYAGWNTAANSTGSVLAQVCAPAAGRLNGLAPEQIEFEKERFLLIRFLNDWLYQARVRKKIIRWINQELDVKPWALGTCQARVEEKIKHEMALEMSPFIKQYFPEWSDKNIEITLPRPRASTLNIIAGGNYEQ